MDELQRLEWDARGAGRTPAEAYRLFHDLPFIGMAVTSPSTKRWLQVNQTLCEFLGYPREVLVHKTWAELTHPGDLAQDTAAYLGVMRGESDGYKLDKRFIRADGTVVYATIDVKAVRNAEGVIDFFVATVADMSARVRAEQAARQSAEMLENLARQVPGVIYQFEMTPDGRSRFPFASDAIREIFEVSPEEVRDDASVVVSRLHPDDLHMVSASIELSARLLTPWDCDYRVILPSRGVRWLRGNARPERAADGSTIWHGFISDITDRQRAHNALLESEQRFRLQIENATDAIVVYDVYTNRFTDANSKAEQLFGMSRYALMQCGLLDVSAAVQSDGTSSPAAAESVIRAVDGAPQTFEWIHRNAAGHEFPCEVRFIRLPY